MSRTRHGAGLGIIAALVLGLAFPRATFAVSIVCVVASLATRHARPVAAGSAPRGPHAPARLSKDAAKRLDKFPHVASGDPLDDVTQVDRDYRAGLISWDDYNVAMERVTRDLNPKGR